MSQPVNQSQHTIAHRLGSHLLKLRNRHFAAIDLILLSLTPALALMLRVDGLAALERYRTPIIVYTLVALALRLSLFYHPFGMYRRYWRYASIDELWQIGAAVMASTALITTFFFVIRFLYYPFADAAAATAGATTGAVPASVPPVLFSLVELPRSIPLLDGLLALFFVGGGRFSVRLVERLHRPRPNGSVRRVAVMGAGSAGTMIVRELQNNPRLGLEPVAFLDDDVEKHDMRIRGIPVLGGREAIPRLVDAYAVKQVIIAMPTAAGKVIRDIVAICEVAGVQTKIIPGIYELLDGTVRVSQLRDVEIEDLLRREPIRTDITAVRSLLEHRRVLVTGGGGSIGSELCRQALHCAPSELIVVGHGENSVFRILNELRRLGSLSSIRAVIADTRFPERVQAVFEEFRPQIVFHAAAHKHVPLMEVNPAEAISNNVSGTRHLLEAAMATGVDHFVMISTDKAVNPTSVMGASKRVAELLVHQAGRQCGRPYVAVRFGNVLGSRGSVVPLFKRQIAAGGPVTVTHPEMKRFFMTIPEAVQLVLQAAVLGQGGEVFVLDMGEPVRIVDLARDLIRLSGLEVDRDIDIVFTHMRPGEKLVEELFVAGEQYRRTRHEKIFIADNASSFIPPHLETAVARLETAARHNDRSAVMGCLCRLVPEFQPMSLNGAYRRGVDQPSG